MIFALLLLSLPAFADRGVPLANSTHALLPNGLTLEVKDGRLWVVRQGLRAEVPPEGDAPGFKSPLKALAQITATEDKRLLTVKVTDDCGTEAELRLVMSSLWARSENAFGLDALARKDYASAASFFARALTTDPGLDEAAANSAAALALSGKTAEALEALDGLLGRQPAKTYLKCLTDPDLAPLLNGPRLVNLRSATPGTAQLKLNDMLKGSQEFEPGKLAAYESVRRIVAAVVKTVVYPGPDEEDGKFHWRSSFVMIDAKTGETLLRLPLVLEDETAGGDSLLHPKPVLASKAKAVAQRVELANRALSDLGLVAPEQIKAILESAKDTPPGTMPFSFPGTTLRLTVASAGAAELKDVASIRDPAQMPGPENAQWAEWLPAAGMAVFQWGQYPGAGCLKNIYDGVSVLRP